MQISLVGRLLATVIAAMLTAAGTMTPAVVPVSSQAGARNSPPMPAGTINPDVVRDIVTVLGDDFGRLWGSPLKLVIDSERELIYIPETNGSVSVFNAKTLNCTGSLPLHTERCLDLALTDDGKKLISIAMDGTARLWDISGESPVQLDKLGLAPDQGWLKMSASKNGDRIAIRSDAEITLVDLQNNRFAIRSRLSKDTDFVEPNVPYGFTISPDGKWMVVCELLKNSTSVRFGSGSYGYQDATLSLWDLSQDQLERVCELSGKHIEDLEFSPDSKRFFATDPDFLPERRIYEWIVRDGELVPEQKTDPVPRFGASFGLPFALGGKLRAMAHGKNLSVTETNGVLTVSRGTLKVDCQVRTAAFLGDDIVLIADSLLQRWDWVDGKYVRHQLPSGHQSRVSGLIFSPESGTLISASNDALLEWNLKTSHELSSTSSMRLEWDGVGAIIPWPGENGFVLRRQIGSTQVTEENVISHQVVTGIARNTTGQLESRFTFLFPTEKESESIWCLAMHPTEPVMATGHHGQQICLWDISGDEQVLLSTWVAHSGHVCDVEFSPDGKQISSAGWDHQTKLWNITPKEARDGVKPAGTTIGTHADIVRSVVWSPDGQHLASGGNDGQILVWDLEGAEPERPRSFMNPEDGAPVRNFLSPATVDSLQFTRAGDQLLSADGKGRVCIWSVTSGVRLKKWQFPGWIWQARFSPDESTVATANNDGTIYILRAPVFGNAAASNAPQGIPNVDSDSPNDRNEATPAQADSANRNSSGEADKPASTRPFRSQWARGKVLAVEQFGDRFDVRISVGEDDEIVVGLRTNVYIGPGLTMPKPGDFPANYVASGQVVEVGPSGSTCNIGPTLRSKANGVPHIGDDVLVRKKSKPAIFVVAKHVVVHDGKVIRWDEVRDRLTELNEQGLIEPTIRFTESTKDEGDQRLADFRDWCAESTVGGFSFGTLSVSAGEYYDSITGDEDLRPSVARQIGTLMANGSPVADAEIVLYTLEERWNLEVYVEHGRLRNPEDEPGLIHSAPNGRFAIYPQTKRFQILVLHEKGMALVNSDQWSNHANIELQPWATISGKFDGPIEFDETAQFETTLAAPGWATVKLEVWDTPLFADRRFQNRQIPPGRISLTRQVKSPRGGGYGIRHSSFELAPGEEHAISIGAFSDEGRKRAEEYLESEKR